MRKTLIGQTEELITTLILWYFTRDMFNRSIAYYLACHPKSTPELHKLLFSVLHYSADSKDCLGLSINMWIARSRERNSEKNSMEQTLDNLTLKFIFMFLSR